ncbi:hypothetical protein L6452_41340 [Arctium lappa]|uniref:Uncharacterized protein n=1 Tax=Arctium lappa TaxID=4217 RepID=A0ACB8XPE3_ARCLA|nr:hypothetical protein L6452_41340 [Arctium lappa]
MDVVRNGTGKQEGTNLGAWEPDKDSMNFLQNCAVGQVKEREAGRDDNSKALVDDLECRPDPLEAQSKRRDSRNGIQPDANGSVEGVEETTGVGASITSSEPIEAGESCPIHHGPTEKVVESGLAQTGNTH